MRRTDRLFELIQILRDGRLHKGSDMAKKLGISLRTLYRDMDTLAASGVPVEGERVRVALDRDGKHGEKTPTDYRSPLYTNIVSVVQDKLLLATAPLPWIAQKKGPPGGWSAEWPTIHFWRKS